MSQVTIDYVDGKLTIRCPFWANDALAGIESKRWSKAKRAWTVGLVSESVAQVKQIAKMGGVTTTDAARQALDAFDQQLQALKSTGERFPSWYKFKRPPLPHQREAYDKFYSLPGAALHLPLQTGKSATAINLCTVHRMEGRIRGVLVLVKRTLRRNWIDALNDDCPIPFTPFLPDTSEERKWNRFMEDLPDYPWIMVGWESLSQGKMAEWIMEFCNRAEGEFAIIGDESTYIANHKAGRTEWALKYAKMARYKYTLSGTPALEGPLNLFSQYRFIDPNIIGIDDFFAFRNRYAIMGGYQREVRPGLKIPTEIVGYTNLDELMHKIAPFTVSHEKTDILQLPPKRFAKHHTTMSKAQQVVYDRIRKEGVMQLAGEPEQVIQNCLGIMLRLHQVAGGYGVKVREERYIGKGDVPKMKLVYDSVELVTPELNPKMIAVAGAIEEIGKRQFLLWAQYQPEIDGLRWWLRKMGLRVGELHGGVPDEQRQPMVRAFARGDLDCVLGNPGTGGMGYTMMAAEYNLFYNNGFKAIDRVQAEDRNWGQGQTKSPVVMDFFCEKTIDMVVWAALQQKQDMSTYLRTRLKEIDRLMAGEVS